eukprot:3796770-Amphidinium_carterae.1
MPRELLLSQSTALCSSIVCVRALCTCITALLRSRSLLASMLTLPTSRSRANQIVWSLSPCNPPHTTNVLHAVSSWEQQMGTPKNIR